MTDKPKKPPLTDAERLAQFKEMGREVGASDAPEAFDEAFKRIVKPIQTNPTK